MRCFTAVDFPLEIKESLHNIQLRIGDEAANVKWVDKENLHVTLKFLGELNELKIAKAVEAQEKIKFTPFELTIDEIGVFPNENYVNVVWVGFKDTEALFELHKKVDISLSKLLPMEREFLGHITIGRVKNVMDKQQFISSLKLDVPKQSFKVDSFRLYSSELTSEGPKYTVLKEFSG